MQDGGLNLLPVVPYTTRPIRVDEQPGREYYFVDPAILDKYRLQGKIIEQRDYQTVKGVWSYCTIDDGQINLAQADYLLISTLEAYQSLQNYYGADKIVPLYIHVEDGARLQRALEREKNQECPNYDELCRRFLADNADFSRQKLADCGVKTYYINDSLTSCIAAIKRDIAKAIAPNS